MNVFLLFLVGIVSTVPMRRSRKRSLPNIITEGFRTIHDYGGKKIEVLESFGMSPEMFDTAENAIAQHYTQDINYSGDAAEAISRAMERRFGGHWTVVIIEDPYLMYTTIPKRADAFALFEVNEGGVFLGRDNYPRPGTEWRPYPRRW